MEIEGEEEWEVLEILTAQIWRGKLQYRARWKGYDEEKTYYDAEGFKGCPHKVRQFHKDHPRAPGPPERLEEWLRSWENGKPVAKHDRDNAPQRKGAPTKSRRHRR